MRDIEIIEKVQTALNASNYDALIVTGADNVQYLSGAPLPFLYTYPDRYVIVLWPKARAPICICPVEWESTIRASSWVRNIRPYKERGVGLKAAVEVLVETLRETVEKVSRVGVDMDRTSEAFFEKLRESMDGVEILGCDEWLRELRVTKTPSEIELLEDLAYRTDHGIHGAAHHVIITSTRTEMSLAEEIRVHCLERELDTVGHQSMSQVASGENSKSFWPLAPRFGVGWEKVLREGELVRMEMTGTLDGYWMDAARIMIMNERVPEKMMKAYDNLVAIRKKVVEKLKPGTRCSEVFTTVKEEAKKRGVEIVEELGIGHGVGVTPYEAPYLIESDNTVLKAGMIVILDPVIYGPDGEIMRSRDMILITDTGCKTLGWYKNWKEPYIPAYTL